MASLKEYLNNKIKSKGSTLAKEKAKGKKYKSIAAAKKAGALYYTDKNGKLMAAVYAGDLKKPIKKSLRPKKRPGSGEPPTQPLNRQPPVKVTRLPPTDPGVKKIKKTVEDSLNKNGGRGDGKKEVLQRQTDPKSPSRLRGAAVMKKIPRSKWESMTKSERRALGLPATRVAAMAGKLRGAKFKDGKSF
tara:strand:+ start:686 stop:1252 length:567 start_codon:yes stop_codon:yes gene_type:complete